MKSKFVLPKRMIALGAPLVLSLSLSAQFGDDEIAFELSPFEVSATENIGYRAVDTLAGIRVRTDLREVGSAISVVTSQFLQDTGATSSENLLQYTVGTEVGGLSGNFGGVVQDAGDLNDEGSRQTPQSNTRVRGLVSADNTRDFFLTDIPWDSYNTTRIDIQRGPNSILFGQGSGGGIVNADIQNATLGSDSGRIEFRVSKFGGRRGSLNLNRDIIDNELALRIALLDNETKYRQDPAYERDRRIYGALRWEPDFLKVHDMRTRFDANFEKGQIRANRPRTTTMIDQITPYFRTTSEQMVAPDGTVFGTFHPLRHRTGYDPYVVGINTVAVAEQYPDRLDIGAGQSNMPNAEPWLRPGGDDFGGLLTEGFWAIFSDPNATDMDYYRANSAAVSNRFSPVSATGGTPAGYRNPNINNWINSTRGYATYQNFLYQGQGLYRDQMISDPGIFDFFSYLIDGPNKREWSDFKAYNLSWEQTFFSERAGFQFSYDFQKYSDGREEYIGGTPRLMIDMYSHLPMAPANAEGDLIPLENPNFGRPVIIARAGGANERFVERKTYRITPYAELDFASFLDPESWLVKILGRHNFTGLLERNEVWRESMGWQRYSLSSDSNVAVGGNPNIGIADRLRTIRTMNYLGDSVVGYSSASDLNLSPISGQRNIGTNTAWYFNSNYLASAPAPTESWTDSVTVGLLPSQNNVPVFGRNQANNPANYVGWNQPGEITVWNGDNAEDRQNLYRDWNESRDIVESWAIVDQWRLLDNHLILLAGFRKDRVREYRGHVPGSTDDITGNRPRIGGNNGHIDLNTPWELIQTSEFRSDVLKTYSAVLRSPEFINRHLPWNMNATVFYSESENFRPVTRVGIYNTPLAPPQADTQEYGFTLEAFDGRVSLKVNRFETNVLNDTITDNTGGFNFPGMAADEVARSSEFALAILTHGRSGNTNPGNNAGHRWLNVNDPEDERIYAYEPLSPDRDSWTSADYAAADALARQQAMATLAAADNDNVRRFMDAWGISDPNEYYQRWLADPDGTGIYDAGWSFLPGFAMTGDTVSKGTEVELFLRPTDNWDIAINVAKVDAMRLNLTGEIGDWVDNRWELYQPDADGVNRGPGGVRWFTGAQETAAIRAGVAHFSRNAFGRYFIFRAQEGNTTPELRPWRFNIVTSYRFTEGRLAGAFVGGGYRWQDNNIIGYEAMEVSADPGADPIGTFNVNRPFKGSKEDAIDLWGGYTRTIMDGRVDWRIQLNLRNVGENKRLLPATTNPDGSIAGYRIVEGMTWELTTSFDF